MAQYKVPQDVEADDKLIGPFSFRQFVYLLIAAGLIALAVAFFQIFPLLGLIPLPPVLLFLALALPLKKDQPMETYLAALVSYYLKPRKRVWTPGQKESTILITAPKIVEEVRTRDLSQEEATHRLSFLADIVDSGGYAIKGANSNPMREDLIAEANMATDIFDNYQSQAIDRAINQEKALQHEKAISEMRKAIEKSEQEMNLDYKPEVKRPEAPIAKTIEKASAAPSVEATSRLTANIPKDLATSSVIVMPEPAEAKRRDKAPTKKIKELADNSDFSIATIAKEANRINGKEKGEIFISLH